MAWRTQHLLWFAQYLKKVSKWTLWQGSSGYYLPPHCYSRAFATIALLCSLDAWTVGSWTQRARSCWWLPGLCGCGVHTETIVPLVPQCDVPSGSFLRATNHCLLGCAQCSWHLGLTKGVMLFTEIDTGPAGVTPLLGTFTLLPEDPSLTSHELL